MLHRKALWADSVELHTEEAWGVSLSEPRCHEGFWSSPCIIHGKLLCELLDLKDGWRERENKCTESSKNLVESGPWEAGGRSLPKNT